MKTLEMVKWYHKQLKKGLSDEEIEIIFDKLIKSRKK